MKKCVARCLIILFLFVVTGCRDAVRVYTHPPGAKLKVNGIPYGKVPKEGKVVDVHWWTFDPPHVTVIWDEDTIHVGHMHVGLGEPNHPEYLIADGILAFFFIIPGAVGFFFNGIGPHPEQHFYSPNRE